MKTLVEGLFPKERLLEYLRYFVVHEVASDVMTKKLITAREGISFEEAKDLLVDLLLG